MEKKAWHFNTESLSDPLTSLSPSKITARNGKCADDEERIPELSSLDNLISGAGDAFGLIGLHALTADYVHHHQYHDNIYSDMRHSNDHNHVLLVF